MLLARWLQIKVAPILAAALFSTAQTAVGSPPKPDVLLIMPDQMRGD